MFQSFIVFVLSVEKFKQTEITFLKQNNKMIIIFCGTLHRGSTLVF